MAHRFIAGETPEEAVPRLRELAKDGVAYTVDLLGEETLSEAEADAYLERYIGADRRRCSADATTSARTATAGRACPPVNISIKLSALCSQLEPAAPECVSEQSRDRLRPLLSAGDGTRRLRQLRYGAVPLQGPRPPVFCGRCCSSRSSRLHRTSASSSRRTSRDAEEDIARAARAGARAWHAVHRPPRQGRLLGRRADRRRPERLARAGLRGQGGDRRSPSSAAPTRCSPRGRTCGPPSARHNPRSIAQAIVKARDAGLADGDIEFQMLYGMAEGCATPSPKRATARASTSRSAQVIPGMAYLVRRLLENTSNQAWFNAASHDSEPPDELLGAAGARRRTLDGPTHRDAGLHQRSRRAAFTRRRDPRSDAGGARPRDRRGFGTTYPLLIGDRRVSDRDARRGALSRRPRPAHRARGAGDARGRRRRRCGGARGVPGLARHSGRERGDILRRAADLIEARRFELAALMVFESAKPWHEADGDVIEADDYLRYYAAQAERLSQPEPMGDVLGERERRTSTRAAASRRSSRPGTSRWRSSAA